MRKVLLAVVVSVLIVGLIAPAALADIKPTHVPHQVMPGEAGFSAAFGAAAFADLWVELEGAGIELPQTGMDGTGFSRDDFVRGPVPIGFTFQYMDGPVEPKCCWPPKDSYDIGEVPPPLPEDWPAELSMKGYQKVWVATNGFVVFADEQYHQAVDVKAEDYVWVQPNLGAWNWWPWQVPIAEPPNNFVAPYWSDFSIGDNGWWKPVEVHFVCFRNQDDNPETPADESLLCAEGDYLVTNWALVQRPRGRLLYQTVGTAPNRKFVVEWLNARNHWNGGLATYELQMFEGSNAILFLYKDFQGKEGQPYMDNPSVVVGMEDWYGTTGVGQAFTAEPLSWAYALTMSPSVREHLFSYDGKWDWDVNESDQGSGGPGIAPNKAAGDMLGFVY